MSLASRRSRAHKVAAILAPALIVAALAGCGGSGDTAGTSGDSSGGSTGVEAGARPSPTKAEFIAKAGAICARQLPSLLAPIGDYLKRHTRSKQAEAQLITAAVKRAVVPRLRTELAEIRALGAPAGDEVEVEAFLQALRRGIVVLEGERRISLSPDVENALGQSQTLARRYGVKTCL
jgi:hypothetical protein